ncbi:MAG: LytR C-terminal domain-containing protein [Patescibacteria group bacterium]
MGISDDIRPHRKKHKGVGFSDDPEKPISFSKPEPEKPKEEVGNEKKDKKDEADSPDFFVPENTGSNEKTSKSGFFDDMPNPKPKKKHSCIKTFVWLLVISGLILLAIYKSPYNPLRSNDTKSTDSTSNSSTKNSYEGETITQEETAKTSTAATSQATTPASTQTAAPAAATTATATKADGTLQVLNGNGVAGEAAKVKATLTADGFTVLSVTNARKFSYQTTIVYYQTDKQAFAELVKTSLSARSVTIEQSDAIAGKYTAVVVVGKK